MSYVAVQPSTARAAPCPRCQWIKSELVAIEGAGAMRKCEACGTTFTDRALASEIHDKRQREMREGKGRRKRTT